MPKEHAAEVERAYIAWRQGVLDEKGIHAILADVIREVDAYRKEKADAQAAR